MPEPMNYVAESLFALNDAAKLSLSGEQKRAELKVARAQTFATLALVEQQRIANLIAYYAPPGAINDIEKGLGL